MLLVVAATATVGVASFAADPALTNPSFEADGDAPAAWALTQGAKTPGDGESLVAVDRTVAKDGKASLRLSGDATTG